MVAGIYYMGYTVEFRFQGMQQCIPYPDL